MVRIRRERGDGTLLFDPGDRGDISDAIAAPSMEHMGAVLEAAREDALLEETLTETYPIEDAPDLPDVETGPSEHDDADNPTRRRSPQANTSYVDWSYSWNPSQRSRPPSSNQCVTAPRCTAEHDQRRPRPSNGRGLRHVQASGPVRSSLREQDRGRRRARLGEI